MEMSGAMDIDSELADLDSEINLLFSSGNGKSAADLVTATHRDKIALYIGGDWESLATFIGVPPGDIDDIKDEYRRPLDRRLAMMRRWYELWGTRAMYLRLLKGLRQIGRRDLIDCLMLYVRHDSSGTHKRCSGLIKHACWNVLSVILISVIVAIIYVAEDSAYSFRVHEVKCYNITSNETDNHTSFCIYKRTENADRASSRNCTAVSESNLPIIHPLFVGRENDMHQVLRKVARVHIVNINGAPGFGKSTLAIHVGYKITKNGIYVRYINMEDRVFTIMTQPRRSESETTVTSDTNIPPQMQKLSTSLTEHRKYSLFVSVSQKSSSNEREDLFEELQSWSEELNCMSVLILDNCDDILASTTRQIS